MGSNTISRGIESELSQLLGSVGHTGPPFNGSQLRTSILAVYAVPFAAIPPQPSRDY